MHKCIYARRMSKNKKRVIGSADRIRLTVVSIRKRESERETVSERHVVSDCRTERETL